MADVVRRLLSWRVLAPTVLLLGLAYCTFWPDKADKVRWDLEQRATGGAGNATVGEYDFVCFSGVSGRAATAFEPILAQKDSRYVDAAKSCGINRTCCNLD